MAIIAPSVPRSITFTDVDVPMQELAFSVDVNKSVVNVTALTRALRSSESEVNIFGVANSFFCGSNSNPVFLLRY
jgi:hypothetical protein